MKPIGERRSIICVSATSTPTQSAATSGVVAAAHHADGYWINHVDLQGCFSALA
ncbi:unnamed protein product [Tuwongella immobilis]|uniref:Uncharacterized protein n=1 Tax=Tuwongella immobilis TaxID=692036 RepID=A0A6C2YHU4_9BACT|nr:unnamed protein product [Tuwongella immobilis]VTR97080.1 unnamed protein product [Tuwongella immobilis]